MNKKTLFNLNKKEGGITFIELLVSVAIFAVILLAVCLFVFWMNYSKSKTEADSAALENARKALDAITLEIRRAKSIYSPTTTSSQLSLETDAYLSSNGNDFYVDFFLCDSKVCFYRGSQGASPIISEGARVTNLQFSQVLASGVPSVQISLTVEADNSSAALTSTASIRSY